MDAVLTELRALLGPAHVLTGDDAAQAAYTPWARPCKPAAVLQPGSTSDISAVLRIAGRTGTPVVPWGGRTGLVDGGQADGALALSLSRMNLIEAIDREAMTVTLQAGCVLETACDAVAAEGLFLPLDLGARGSATIGGVISTNAGGNRVLRYGMTRDMVLGLEAVLADGTIVTSLNHLIKNNAGYDIKQLFIGSEGTLGIVTRAVLRLQPTPATQATAFLATASFAALTPLLRRLEAKLSGSLSAFEVMWPSFYELVTTPPAAGRPVLVHGQAYYVLVEALGADPDADPGRFEAVLEGALADGLIVDAAIAKNQAERDRMWALRDDVRQTARHGPGVTFDVSLPIREMEAYVSRIRADLIARWSGMNLTVFGHLGDGNLHVIASVGDAAARHEVEKIVYEPLRTIGGSISAEHGIGLQKKAYLPYSRTPEEIALMVRLKAALDPGCVLNPGKVV